jgi:uncharacterized protein
MNDQGDGRPKDALEAVTWYRWAADQGGADAQFLLGILHGHGEGVLRPEALEQCRRAADPGNGEGQLNPGVMEDQGGGVSKDAAEAVKYYRRAADRGDVDAQCTLGLLYAQGDGVPKDAVEAYKWLSLAGAGGNKIAVQGHSFVEHTMSRDAIIEAQRLSRAFVPRKEISGGGGATSEHETSHSGRPAS